MTVSITFAIALSAAVVIAAVEGRTVAAPRTSTVNAQRIGSVESRATGVFINERELTIEQVNAMIAIYGVPPPRGRFWYDPVSGLYGLWGREAAGSLRPGHDFGPLSPRSSAGTTGVFVNGRELNVAEVAYLQVLFSGQVRPGRVWLDGRTWNVGVEGSPMPIANLAMAIRRQQQQREGWSRRTGDGGVLSSDGNCTMVSVPGAPTYGTSACD